MRFLLLLTLLLGSCAAAVTPSPMAESPGPPSLEPTASPGATGDELVRADVQRIESPDVDLAMPYFRPYWCGWGYRAWWWNADDCIDIAVGAGESLDVEQITPLRVLLDVWPPAVGP